MCSFHLSPKGLYHYDNLRAENSKTKKFQDDFHLQDGRDHKAPEYLHILFHYISPFRGSPQSNVSPLVEILIMYLEHIAVLFVLPPAMETLGTSHHPILEFSSAPARWTKGGTDTLKLFQGPPSFLHSREGHVCACIPAFEELSHSHSTDGLGSSTKPAIGTVITNTRKAW